MRATFVVLLFAFIGCTRADKVPQNILAKTKMEKILWDMIQADRFSVLYIQKDSTTKNVKIETLKLYEQVFRVHKVSKEDFLKSYKYYLSRPDIAKGIFDSISVKAERQKAILNIPDSLKAQERPL